MPSTVHTMNKISISCVCFFLRRKWQKAVNRAEFCRSAYSVTLATLCSNSLGEYIIFFYSFRILRGDIWWMNGYWLWISVDPISHTSYMDREWETSHLSVHTRHHPLDMACVCVWNLEEMEQKEEKKRHRRMWYVDIMIGLLRSHIHYVRLRNRVHIRHTHIPFNFLFFIFSMQLFCGSVNINAEYLWTRFGVEKQRRYDFGRSKVTANKVENLLGNFSLSLSVLARFDLGRWSTDDERWDINCGSWAVERGVHKIEENM